MHVSGPASARNAHWDFSLIDADSLLPTASGCVLSGRRQQPVFRCWEGRRRPRREASSDRTVQIFALCSRLSFDRHGTSELFPMTRQTRRGRSAKLAASSASLRSVLRGVPICARMVSPRARSVTWIARAAMGKSDGISPVLIPSRKRRSSSAAPPVAAFCKKR